MPLRAHTEGFAYPRPAVVTRLVWEHCRHRKQPQTKPPTPHAAYTVTRLALSLEICLFWKFRKREPGTCGLLCWARSWCGSLMVRGGPLPVSVGGRWLLAARAAVDNGVGMCVAPVTCTFRSAEGGRWATGLGPTLRGAAGHFPRAQRGLRGGLGDWLPPVAVKPRVVSPERSAWVSGSFPESGQRRPLGEAWLTLRAAAPSCAHYGPDWHGARAPCG